ncbi:MAG: AraC family transcriptional regulator [Clostridia bacterium]|nr:AraC family transcriptional regulator [Clostridia bacterium]
MILIERGEEMLYITHGALEHCSADKEHIKIICPGVWIHYITDGKGYFNGNTLGAGQAFIVYKNDFCEYFPDKNDPWTYIWMRFEGEDSEGLFQSCGIPSASGVFSYDHKERLGVLAPIVFSELTLQRANRSFTEAAAKMILSMHIQPNLSEGCAWDEKWVVLAKEFIASNYHKQLTVEQIADEVHIDRQYLRNLFVKYTGMPTKRYLDCYRMEKAAKLLAIKDISVGMVASSVGYTDQLSFSKAFKKHFGVSPSESRNR